MNPHGLSPLRPPYKICLCAAKIGGITEFSPGIRTKLGVRAGLGRFDLNETNFGATCPVTPDGHDIGYAK